MSLSPNDSLRIQDFADLFGFPASAVVSAVEQQRYRVEKSRVFFTIPDLAARWCVSVPQIYKLVREAEARIVNVGQGSKRKKILVPASVVAQIEKARAERMPRP
jgi:hypothetical protein